MLKQVSLLLVLALSTSCACTSKYTPDAEARESSDNISRTVKVIVDMDLVMSQPGMPVEKKPVGGGSGSGVVVAMENHALVTYTLIATARHVCKMEPPVEIPEGMKEILKYEGVYSIKKVDGTVMPAKLVFVSAKADVCFLQVLGIVSTVAPMATYMPPLGAKITSTGAPKGIFGHNLAVTTEGRYSGIDPGTYPEPVMVVGMTAAPGASGGPLWYRGEVIGILIATGAQGGYLVLGVPLLIVRAEMADALVAWRK